MWFKELTLNIKLCAHDLLAEFLDRKVGSAFHTILTRLPCWNGKPKVFAHLHITSATDLNLELVARQMKNKGEILSYSFDWMSGKLLVTWPSGYIQKFTEPASLEAMASLDVREAIKSRRTTRTARKNKRKQL